MSTATGAQPVGQYGEGVPRPPDGVAARLQTVTDRRDSAVILQARGEVDAYTLPAWQRIVRETAAHATTAGPVIVDITGLDFISCSALATLASQAEVCREQGSDLAMVCRAGVVHRVAAATGLDQRLAIYTTTDAAVRASAPS
ncbi:anti-sigma factor antagonist [Mycobacterium sp.]|uniref:anti-sigma factor antagonist n=1 Tax=Mycobacterium sp. TaxID=1785 RepID=UPI0031D97F0F